MDITQLPCEDDEAIRMKNMVPLLKVVLDRKFEDPSMRNCKSLYYMTREKLFDGIQEITCREPRFSLNKINISGMINITKHSQVWKATMSKQHVAIKQISLRERSMAAVVSEVELLRRCRHERVAALLGCFGECDPFLVMPLYAGSLAMCQKLGPRNLARFMWQISDGLSFIHSQDVIHRGLHPENLLITSENNVVITGFRNAIQLDKDHTTYKEKGPCGIAHYQCPSANRDHVFSKQTDIFSMGVLFFELTTGAALMSCQIEGLDDEDPFAFYSDCFELGKIVELENETTKKFEAVYEDETEKPKREALSLIVQRETPFPLLILNLICEDVYKRPKAEEFRDSPDLEHLLRQHNLSPCNTNNDRTLDLAKELSIIKPEKREFKSLRKEKNAVSENDVLLAGLYCDYLTNSSSEESMIRMETGFKDQNIHQKPKMLDGNSSKETSHENVSEIPHVSQEQHQMTPGSCTDIVLSRDLCLVKNIEAGWKSTGTSPQICKSADSFDSNLQDNFSVDVSFNPDISSIHRYTPSNTILKEPIIPTYVAISELFTEIGLDKLVAKGFTKMQNINKVDLTKKLLELCLTIVNQEDLKVVGTAVIEKLDIKTESEAEKVTKNVKRKGKRPNTSTKCPTKSFIKTPEVKRRLRLSDAEDNDTTNTSEGNKTINNVSNRSRGAKENVRNRCQEILEYEHMTPTRKSNSRARKRQKIDLEES